MKRLLLAGISILSLVISGRAAGLILVDEAYWTAEPPVVRPPDAPPGWPRPIPRAPRVHRFCPLELKSLQAEVRIRDQVAVTTVEQEFHNPGSQRIEGTFLLPLPKGAQIDKFSMEVDGRQMEAELLAAGKARGLYEDIVRKSLDPALLEYVDHQHFKVRIFPIEPGGRKRIRLSWTQLLKSENGMVGYAYPLSSLKFSAGAVPSIGLKVNLETREPLKTIYSPTHEVEIARSGERRATLGYESKEAKPDSDFHLYFAGEGAGIGVNLMTFRAPDEEGYFVLLAAPGVDAKEERVVPKDVVFVFDTSGSMAGRKLEQAGKALLYCIESLNPEDRFEVIRFSTEAEGVFGSLAGASEENRRRAESFVRDLKAAGGTAIDEALRKGLSLRPGDTSRPFVMIFLTDGRPTVGVTDEASIVASVSKSASGTRIFCFGVGHDVNTHLLDKITEHSRAFSQYVLPQEDIEVKVSGFFARIKDPVLVDPVLTFSGGIRASKMHPSSLPDLFRGEQLVVVGRFAGSGPSAAILDGRVEGRPRRISHDVDFGGASTGHDFIPRLWATRRVGYLLEQIRLHGENSELKEEVTGLARRYSIVTPYTAYLIVEDEAKRDVPMSRQSLPRLQEDRFARQRIGRHAEESITSRSGLAPLSQARAELALKSATAPASAIAAGGAEGQRGLAGALPDPAGSGAMRDGFDFAAADNADGLTRQSRFAGGRSFYRNGDQWIDAAIQGLDTARRIKIPFGSSEYFELLNRDPSVREWLALGTRVQFALGGTVYEIHE